MTDQEINEKIGRHFGWREIFTDVVFKGLLENFKLEIAEVQMGISPNNAGLKTLPNWSGDLNLMHEAEKTIGSFQMPLESGSLPAKYWDLLCESDTCCIHVGSRERALAFIKLYNL